jgi:hypothetical protein
MTFDIYSWGSEASFDAMDHWLDDALRAVPLPDGFFARLNRLAEGPPDRADDKEDSDRPKPTRGLSGSSRRFQSSGGEIRTL